MRALEEVHETEERRMDARFGLVCSVIANCNRAANQRPYRVEDFMPKPRASRPQTREELEAKVRSFCSVARSIQEGDRRSKSKS